MRCVGKPRILHGYCCATTVMSAITPTVSIHPYTPYLKEAGSANGTRVFLLCFKCSSRGLGRTRGKIGVSNTHTHTFFFLGGCRCVCCMHCGSSSPGFHCEWQNNYNHCGPCASLVTCPVCHENFMEEELLLQCRHCDR